MNTAQNNPNIAQKIASAAGGIEFSQGNQVEGDQAEISKPAVSTEAGSYVPGTVNVGGGTFIGRDRIAGARLDPEAIARIFAPLYAAIEQRADTSPADKGDLIEELRDLQFEVGRGDDADAGLLQRRLRNLGRVAPDILRLVVAALADPVAGFSAVAARTAEAMRADLEAAKA